MSSISHQNSPSPPKVFTRRQIIRGAIGAILGASGLAACVGNGGNRQSTGGVKSPAPSPSRYATPPTIEDSPRASYPPAAQVWVQGGLRGQFGGGTNYFDRLADGSPLFHFRVGLIPVAALMPYPGRLNIQPILDAMEPWIGNGRYWALRLVIAGGVDGPGSTASPPEEAGLIPFSIQGKNSFDWWNPRYGAYHRNVLSETTAALLDAVPIRYLARLLYVQFPIGYQGENTVMQNNLSSRVLGEAYLPSFQQRVTTLEQMGYTDQIFHDTVVTDIAGAWQRVQRRIPGVRFVGAINPRGMFLQQELYTASAGQAGVPTGLSVARVAQEMRQLGLGLQFDGAGRKEPIPYQPDVAEAYKDTTDLGSVIADMRLLGSPSAGLFYGNEMTVAARQLVGTWGRAALLRTGAA